MENEYDTPETTVVPGYPKLPQVDKPYVNEVTLSGQNLPLTAGPGLSDTEFLSENPGF